MIKTTASEQVSRSERPVIRKDHRGIMGEQVRAVSEFHVYVRSLHTLFLWVITAIIALCAPPGSTFLLGTGICSSFTCPELR